MNHPDGISDPEVHLFDYMIYIYIVSISVLYYIKLYMQRGYVYDCICIFDCLDDVVLTNCFFYLPY